MNRPDSELMADLARFAGIKPRAAGFCGQRWFTEVSGPLDPYCLPESGEVALQGELQPDEVLILPPIHGNILAAFQQAA